METVCWGMIGCGDVTEVKSGPGLYKSENSVLKGVFNRNRGKAESWCRRHNISTVYTTIEELLNDDEVHIIYIATPPSSHVDLALKVIESGKIPYIEKPLTTNYRDAEKIADAGKNMGVTPYVAFYRRGLDKFIEIKKIIDSGTLGKIAGINITQTGSVTASEKDPNNLPWRVIPDISGGGRFLDIGTHLLDCLIWYFGEITEISGTVKNRGNFYPAEDTITAVITFKSGVKASGFWSFVTDIEMNRVEIFGERGTLTYDALSADSFKIEENGKERIFTFNTPEHISMPYQQSIINELTGMSRSNASFKDAMNLVKYCEKLLSSYYSN